MLKRMELFNIASIFLLVISIIMIVYTMEREREFLKYHNLIQESSVNGAAYAINLQLQNKHRHVRLFLEEYSRLFVHLERYPDDEKTINNIHRRMQQRFQDFFTFTITDQEGRPVITDIESLVGEACQNDLNEFVSSILRKDTSFHNEAFVHPQAYHYHYDVMAPLRSNSGGVRIFFTSFYLDEIIDIIKTHEVPGQTLMLVRQTMPELIEVSREGARDKLKRDSNLTAEERSRITVYQDIPDTDWRLINLPEENFQKDYIYGLWKEVVIILVIIAFALMILVLVLVRVSEKRLTKNGR